MNFKDFLTSPTTFQAPAKILEGLDTADAERHLTGAPHSIAQITAHAAFWQEWFHARCEGREPPMVSTAAAGWPDVPAASWPAIRSRFVEGLERLASVADGDVTRRLDPPIDFPPLAQYTVSDVLIHVAAHNGHHLGQIVLLRQLMGRWPPLAGRCTW